MNGNLMKMRLFVVLVIVALLLVVFVLCSAESESEKIVSTAENMVGEYPYSWDEGDGYGPTKIKVADDNEHH